MATRPGFAIYNSQPGTNTYYRRYWHPTQKVWTITNTEESVPYGSSGVLDYQSSYVTSNGVSPTSYSRGQAFGTGEYLNEKWASTDQIISRTDRADIMRCSSDSAIMPLSCGNSPLNGWYNKPSSIIWSTKPLEEDWLSLDNKFLSELNNNSAEIGAFLVELGETVSYVTSRAIGIGKFALAIATGRWSSALKQLGISKKAWKRRNKHVGQSIAGRWLEWNFAIKPLVGDVAKFASLYSDPSKALKRLTFVTSASTKHSLSGNAKVRMSTTTYYRINKFESTGFSRLSYRWRVHDFDAVARNALGIEAAAPALWEGVPFSWLVDYVVGIGDFLSNLTATRGLSPISGYRSTRLKQTCKVDYTKVTSSVSHYKWLATWSIDAYRRWPLTNFPKPNLEFTLPDLKLRQASYAMSLGAILLPYKRRQ